MDSIRHFSLRRLALPLAIFCFILLKSDAFNMTRGTYGYHLERLRARGPVTEATAASELKAMDEHHRENDGRRVLAGIGMLLSVVLALKGNPVPRSDAPAEPQKSYDY